MKNCPALFIKNSCLQIVIYKKLNFWEEYTPLMRVFKGDISYLVYNLGKSVHAQKNSGSRSVKTLGFLFSTTKYSCVVLGRFQTSVWQAQNKDYRRNFTIPNYNFDNPKKRQGVPILGLGYGKSQFWDLDSAEKGLIYCRIAPVEKKVPFVGQKLILAIMKFIPSVRIGHHKLQTT